jgi:hypothetical protein
VLLLVGSDWALSSIELVQSCIVVLSDRDGVKNTSSLTIALVLNGWQMDWVCGVDLMEIVISGNVCVPLSDVSTHDSLSSFRPLRAVHASLVVWVDKLLIIAWILHRDSTFKLHTINERLKKSFGLFLQCIHSLLKRGVTKDSTHEANH